MKRKKRADPVGTLRLLGKRNMALAKLQQAERKRAAAPLNTDRKD